MAEVVVRQRPAERHRNDGAGQKQHARLSRKRRHAGQQVHLNLRKVRCQLVVQIIDRPVLFIVSEKSGLSRKSLGAAET
jgi:hypothetical protein